MVNSSLDINTFITIQHQTYFMSFRLAIDVLELMPNEIQSFDILSVFPALLLLYDVTNKTSFENTRAWLAEIREYAQDNVVIMLLGEHTSFRGLGLEVKLNSA